MKGIRKFFSPLLGNLEFPAKAEYGLTVISREFVVVFLLLAILLSSTACSQPQKTETTEEYTNELQQLVDLQGDPEAGKSKFMGTCASCHGIDGKGMKGLGEDLTSMEIQERSDEILIQTIKTGVKAGSPENKTRVDMPPKGNNPSYSDQDLADIVAFIRTLK